MAGLIHGPLIDDHETFATIQKVCGRIQLSIYQWLR
jgi:hypothetical protein